MSGPMERRSPFLRILDTFLQEENIKWVLGLGVCILLGSSLRLVTLHWVEYTPVWKYLILLGYTVTVFGLGEFGYHRLGLRKTGAVLMSLTVLLIPISFLALHWIQPRSDASFLDGLPHPGLCVLLGINLVWSACAAHRIFRHFLRGSQPTFLVCYLILALSGAIVPGLPTSWGLGLALVLWAVFTVGTAKVNRHVFWLTEEHRQPRIFGFFPILLLGSQYAAVFVLGIAGHVASPWLGLLATLISLPVLLAADAVARVFEQRTGGLIRPIPWSISGPLAFGSLLGIAGVLLALTGFPASAAIVPTAVIAAVAMGVVGHRTRNSAFVWVMLFCIVIAYQTSPVFFKELVLQLRDQAASAVRESRLPYAFYGLTYAPLIVVFSLVAAFLRRRQNVLFARPFQQFATVVPCLLLSVSFTHPSAVLPVAVVLCPLFAAQAVLFRNQHYLISAATAFLAAAYGAPGFAERVLVFDVPVESAMLLWASAAGLLLFPGALCDRWAQTLCHRGEEPPMGMTRICQFFSLGSAIIAAGTWLLQFGLPTIQGDFGQGMISGTVISVLLAARALRWLKSGLGELTLAFATLVAFTAVVPREWTPISNLNLLFWFLLGLWGLSYLLERVATTRIARAFGPASFRVSMGGLSCLTSLFLLGWVGQHCGFAGFPWMTSLLIAAWELDASRRLRSRDFAFIAWSSVFLLVTAQLTVWMGTAAAAPWWMAAWVVTGLALLGTQRFEKVAWLSPLQVMLPVLFVTIGVASLSSLGGPQRLAGGLALVGLIAGRQSRFGGLAFASVALLATWQLLAAFTGYLSGHGGLIWELTKSDAANFGLPVAALAAMSLWAFESRRLRGFVQQRGLTPSTQCALNCRPATERGLTPLLGQIPLLGTEQLGATTESASPETLPTDPSIGIRENEDSFEQQFRGELLTAHRALLLAVALFLLSGAIALNHSGSWTFAQLAWAATAWLGIAGTALSAAVRTQGRHWVWWAEVALLCGLAYFNVIGALNLMDPGLEYIVLFAGLTLWSVGHFARTHPRFAVLTSPFQQSGFWLPLAVLPLAAWREYNDAAIVWAGANSLPLLGSAAFYFLRAMERRRLGMAVLSAVLLNVACAFLWKDLNWTDPQLFLMPLGISVLALTELMNREIPQTYHNRLRYVGSLMILVSPTFHIVTGSWLHILTLMVASAAIALTAIGLRIRTLLYTSTAFLLADLVAMVARGSLDEPNVVWIAGVLLGASIIALGAVCENHREVVLSRLRGLAAELEQWA